MQIFHDTILCFSIALVIKFYFAIMRNIINSLWCNFIKYGSFSALIFKARIHCSTGEKTSNLIITASYDSYRRKKKTNSTANCMAQINIEIKEET